MQLMRNSMEIIKEYGLSRVEDLYDWDGTMLAMMSYEVDSELKKYFVVDESFHVLMELNTDSMNEFDDRTEDFETLQDFLDTLS